MPPHRNDDNDDNDDKTTKHTATSSSEGGIMLQGETLANFNDKGVAASLQDGDDLGDVQLTPTTSKEEGNGGALWKENRPSSMVVDPWAVPSEDANADADANGAKITATSEGDGETKTAWGNVWGSFRSQWQERREQQQQQLQMLPTNQPASQNPDEAVSAVVLPEITTTGTISSATTRRFPSFGFSAKEPLTNSSSTTSNNSTNGKTIIDPNQVSNDDLALLDDGLSSLTPAPGDQDRLGFAAARQQQHKLRPYHQQSTAGNNSNNHNSNHKNNGSQKHGRSSDERVYQQFVKRQREQHQR